MNNSRFGNRSGGGRDSFRGGFGGRGSDRPQMYDAVCSECGRDCKIPFRPNGDRPVFCSDCFEKQNGGSERPSRGSFDRPRFNDRGAVRSASTPDLSGLNRNIEILTGKLDKLIYVLSSNPAFNVPEMKTSGEFKSNKLEGLAGMVASFKTVDKPSKVSKKKRTIKSVSEEN